jgi:putative membrane protein
MYYNGSFGGMNFVWWFIWMIMLFWIFATPYDIPGQRKKKDAPLYTLQTRFAAGEVPTEGYRKKKTLLERIW